MIISKFGIWLFYLLSIMLFMNYSNFFFFWMFMEFNLLCFIVVMILFWDGQYSHESMNYVIYYFLIQSSGSILLLNNFLYEDWVSIFNCDTMLLLSLILKIGLFPFSFWVYNVSNCLTPFTLGMLLTLQKIPLLMVLFSQSPYLLLLVLSFSLFYGTFALLFSFNLTTVLVSSSISYAFILYFFFQMSNLNFLSFFFVYSLAILSILWSKESPTFSSPLNWALLSSIIFLLGLPPMTLFFYKFMFSLELYMMMGFSEMLFFWLIGFAGLFGYMKCFFSFFLKGLDLYYSLGPRLLASSFPLFIYILSFFLFLCI